MTNAEKDARLKSRIENLPSAKKSVPGARRRRKLRSVVGGEWWVKQIRANGAGDRGIIKRVSGGRGTSALSVRSMWRHVYAESALTGENPQSYPSPSPPSGATTAGLQASTTADSTARDIPWSGLVIGTMGSRVGAGRLLLRPSGAASGNIEICYNRTKPRVIVSEDNMSWRRLTAVENDPAPPWMPIAVGFGQALVTMDGKVVYDGEKIMDRGGEPYLVEDVELIAAIDPDHDWRIIMDGPLCGETYQRQGDQWVMVDKNKGFA